MKLKGIIGLLTILVLSVTGCSSTAPAAAAALGDPLDASTTYAAAGSSNHLADVSVCNGLIAASDVVATIGDLQAGSHACPDRRPGYDQEGFTAATGNADFGEIIQIATSAANAQSEMAAFITGSASTPNKASDTSGAQFQDLATDIRYAERQASPIGVGPIYSYSFALRQGCALIALTIDAPQPIAVATLRAVVKASLSRLRNGVRPYPASGPGTTTSGVGA